MTPSPISDTIHTSEREVMIVVAAALNGEIGGRGDLLWHLSGDLKRFKAITMGSTVVMGRKTWESLPKRPLPGRENIVVSRKATYPAPGAILAGSVQEALHKASSQKVCIIGGGSIYQATLPLCTCIDFTQVYAEFPQADTFFPLPDPQEWRLESESEILTDPKSGLKYCHRLYRRIEPHTTKA